MFMAEASDGPPEALDKMKGSDPVPRVVGQPSVVEEVRGQVEGAALPDVEKLQGLTTFKALFESQYYPEVSELFSEDLDLQAVAEFADNLVSELGLEGAGFFKSPALMKYFLEYLKENIIWYEQRVVELKALMTRARGCAVFEKLPDGWEEVLRRGFYYSAFLHFGQFRKGEKERDGKVQNYLKHPMRAMFDHLAEKGRVFDLLEWVTTELHDTFEDFRKGLVGVLYMEGEDLDMGSLYGDKEKVTAGFAAAQKKAKANETFVIGVYMKMIDDLEDIIKSDDPFPLSMRMKLLTKISSDRGRTWVDMYLTILECESIDEKLSAFAALCNVKIGADRMDNSRTAGSNEKVVAETRHLCLKQSEMLREVNRTDWFRDYLFCIDNPEFYRRLMQMRREANVRRGREFDGEINDIEVQLREEFLREMKLQTRNSNLQEGIDYVLEFREASLRFRDPIMEAESLIASDAAKGFRNYLIFHPVGHSPDLAEAARDVFKSILRDPSGDFNYPELEQSKIGRVITDASNKGGEARLGGVGENDEYGTVVWGVWESEEDCALAMLGKMYVLRYYKTESENRDLHMTMHGNPVDYDEISNQVLEFLDRIEPFTRDLNRNHQSIQGLSAERSAKLSEYLYKKLMTLHLPKRKVKVQLDQWVSDEIEVPVDLPYQEIVNYVSPHMIGTVQFDTIFDGAFVFSSSGEVFDEGRIGDRIVSATQLIENMLEVSVQRMTEGISHSLIPPDSEL